jgi:beta-lactamase regulating signal transducer with metallopeptidase domain
VNIFVAGGTVNSSEPILLSGMQGIFMGLCLDISHFIESNSHYLAFCWFIGFILFMVRYLGGLFYIGKLKSRGLVRPGKHWKEKALELARKSGIRKNIRIFESIYVRVPLTAGYLKPVILFPIGMLGSIPPEQVEAILLHEMAHILRRDYLVNALQSIMEAIFFYHPAVWIISEKIRTERENICDDIAVKQSNDTLNYIKALTNMENLTSKSPVLINAFSGRKRRLINRVRRMVYTEGRRIRPAEGLVTLLVLITLAIIFGAGANINTSKAGTAAYPGGPAINPDAVNSFTSFAASPSDAGTSHATGTDVMIPVSGEYRSTLIAGPDTTKGSPEDKARAEAEKDAAREEALKKIQEAEFLKQEAMQAYHDALKDYHDLMKDFRMEEWESNFNWVFSDSLDSTAIIIGHNPRGVYFFSDKDFKDIPMPEFYEFDGPDPGKYDYSYRFRSPKRVEIYKDGDDQEIIIRERDKDILWEEKNRQVEEELKWVEKDLLDKQRQIEKRIIVPSPDIRIHAPRVEPYYFYKEEKGPEHIIRQELLDDRLIFPGKDYIIELNPGEMYINGEKQPKDVYKKYKKIYEGLTEDLLEVPVKMVF